MAIEIKEYDVVRIEGKGDDKLYIVTEVEKDYGEKLCECVDIDNIFRRYTYDKLKPTGINVEKEVYQGHSVEDIIEIAHVLLEEESFAASDEITTEGVSDFIDFIERQGNIDRLLAELSEGTTPERRGEVLKMLAELTSDQQPQ